MARCLFVTGKLAAQALRDILEHDSPYSDYELAVLPISVAALMDTGFIAKHLENAGGCDRVMIPGLCKGDIRLIADKLGVEVFRGPGNLKDLHSGSANRSAPDGYGTYRVQILAEIVDAHRMSFEEILSRATYFKDSGADIIDLGCPVEGGFPEIEKVVRELKSRGFLVSVDSFNPEDILNANRGGADFVLSVHSGNLDIVRGLQCKVVVIPDPDQALESLDRSVARLEAWGMRYIIDPILSPICMGFSQSLQNYIALRRRYPKAEMLLGLGNLTELTDADTTGVTAVMAGIIEELGIDYVLTTEEIHWARGAVRELDLARRLMHYACRHRILPKHLSDGLLTIKDPPFEVFREAELRSMQEKVRDRNYRIFTDQNFIYVFNNRVFIKDTDIQAIFKRLNIENAAHAFYLGKELQKALLAVRLGKRYVQEEDLRWGYLSS